MKNTIYTFLAILSLLGLLGLSGCAEDGLSAPEANGQNQTGIAGSLARFSIVGNFMYAINNSTLKWYDVSLPEDPIFVDSKVIGTGIETIFPFAGKLFIGSQQGMFIYDIGTNGEPEYVSEYTHVQNCDPVATNGQYAFVTLRSGGNCRVGFSNNQLDILDVSDIYNPELVSTWNMFHPRGVGVDGNTLFVCDSQAGLKIFDVSDPLDINLIKQFDDFTAYDVIPLNGLLLVISPDNIYQFDYSDLNNIVKVSEIPIEV